MQPDSVITSVDTQSIAPTPASITIENVPDSQDIKVNEADTVVSIVQPVVAPRQEQAITITKTIEEGPEEPKVEPLPIEEVEFGTPIELYTTITNKDSSLVKPAPQKIQKFHASNTGTVVGPVPRERAGIFEKEWVFGVAMFALVIFVIVRVYYQKYLSSIATSLINMHLSEKLLRQKNVIARRVYFLLNMLYFISLGIYFYLVIKKIGIHIPSANDFFLFLTILGIIMVIIMLRIIITQFVGTVFDAYSIFREYLHNTFIINKNVGLYLLPIVLSIIYVDHQYKHYLFVLATILISISLIIRYLVGLQIILKHNIFLFYSILYLCTLEILPVLLGIKFVLTLK